ASCAPCCRGRWSRTCSPPGWPGSSRSDDGAGDDRCMHVLIVENDHRLATSLRMALGESGMSVDVAHDGQEGLETAVGDDYDVIVLEKMLPILNGWEVAREVRPRRGLNPIPLPAAA